MGTIMEGMAFGTGSAIAHRAVGAVAGSMFGGSDNKEQAAAPVAAAAAPAAPASTATFAGRGQDCAALGGLDGGTEQEQRVLRRTGPWVEHDLAARPRVLGWLAVALFFSTFMQRPWIF